MWIKVSGFIINLSNVTCLNLAKDKLWLGFVGSDEANYFKLTPEEKQQIEETIKNKLLDQPF